jgi:hypothetical protein
MIPRPRRKDKDLRVAWPVVGAVALVVLPVVVMALAVMVLLPVVMGGRIVGAMLGDGGSGAPNGECEGNGERRGYARCRLHFCLLMGEFRS